MKKQYLIFITILMLVGLNACGMQATLPPTSTITATISPTITNTITPSPEPTSTPTPTPTPIGGGSGKFFFTESVAASYKLDNGNTIQASGQALYLMDQFTANSKLVLDRKVIEERLGKPLVRVFFFPSPDGKMILVRASTSMSMDGPDSCENYLVNSELTEWIPLLDSSAFTSAWIWAPDSSKLLGSIFSSNEVDLLIVNKDGSNLQELSKNGYRPSWSKDKSTIFWIEAGKPVKYNLDSGEKIILDPNISSEFINAGPRKVSDISVSPFGDWLIYITDKNVSILTKYDLTEGKVIIDGSSDSCKGKYPSQVIAWSPDGKYFLVRAYNCVKLSGLLIPKASDRIISIEDAKIHVYRMEKGCGWSPDGSFVKIEKIDGSYQMIFEDLSTSTVVASFRYSGNCPAWIR